jgi:hypothetical protein
MNPTSPQSPSRPFFCSYALARKGGAWLGAARSWMQTRFKNGESVTWGSNDRLEGAPVTVKDIEEVAACAAAEALNEPPHGWQIVEKASPIRDILAGKPTIQPLDQYENALIQYLKHHARTSPRLSDLLAIWSERNGIAAKHIPLDHLAECMWDIVARYNLFGCSNTIPMIRGPLGIYADAAPERAWQFGLDTVVFGRTRDDHWCNLIAVLASRLMLTEVSKLPGYDGQASFGPFGVKGEGVAS